MDPKEKAYNRAQEDACNTDCLRYRAGTCEWAWKEKNGCYRFRQYYDEYLEIETTRACLREHIKRSCSCCYLNDHCKILYF